MAALKGVRGYVCEGWKSQGGQHVTVGLKEGKKGRVTCLGR